MALNINISTLTPIVRDIATDDDPLLKKVASNVENIMAHDIQQLIVDMIATMYAAKGIGLAAPQIRVSSRVMVFYLPENRDDSGNGGIPLTVLINPTVTPVEEETVSDFEGVNIIA